MSEEEVRLLGEFSEEVAPVCLVSAEVAYYLGSSAPVGMVEIEEGESEAESWGSESGFAGVCIAVCGAFESSVVFVADVGA